jgi:hypothetical protein
MSSIRHGLIAALWVIGLPTAVQAGEPLFGYVYTTEVMPKGQTEVEQWVTLREGQSQGHFHDLKLRTEVEHGVTDNFQISGYLNTSYISANRNSVDATTEGLDIPPSHDPARPFERLRFDGVSAELIWRVMSPYKKPLGLALYVEPEIGPHERAIELKVIAQKNFMEDRLVLAANAFVEFENEQQDGERDKATQLEFDLGASYRFRPNWSFGLEYRNHNEYEGHTLAHSHQEHTAHFFGPNIHYANQKWFFTLSALYQLHATGFNDEQRENIVHNRIYGDEHTRWDGIRLKVGRAF